MTARLAALLVVMMGAAPEGALQPAAPGPAGTPASSEAPDPALAQPSIDCPLHAKGVGHDALRPFAEVEKYIEHLERPDRAAWQRPDELVAFLRLKGSETVADVGAGSGYFTFRFARALPRGRVLAIDVDPEMVRHVHHRLMSEKIANVQAVLADPRDPSVDGRVDLVFLCDVLHHVQERQDWLRRLFAELRPGARLVIVEFKEGRLPQGPPEDMKIPRARQTDLLRGAGFELVSEDLALLPYQTIQVYRRPGAGP
jgi:SAM-dependent methyltransferase